MTDLARNPDPAPSSARAWRGFRASLHLLVDTPTLFLLTCLEVLVATHVVAATLIGGFLASMIHWSVSAAVALAGGAALGAVHAFFQGALVHGALATADHPDGDAPGLLACLRAALARGVDLVGWGVISGAVNAGLKLAKREHRVIGAAGQVSWATATWLVVPVIMTERKGPLAALERALDLFSRTWAVSLFQQGGLWFVGAVAGAALATLAVGGLFLAFTTGQIGWAIGLPLAAVGLSGVLYLVQATLRTLMMAAAWREVGRT